MVKRERKLLASCSTILLCICIIIGATYAYFTDSVTVGNHLKAGYLDVELIRTNLEYASLNAHGELEIKKNTERYNFTHATNKNIFGLDADNIVIAPGAYFDADMLIRNNGNVAFNYRVEIRLRGESNALAEQLQVTLTHPNGTKTVKKLSELAGGLSIAAGKMKATDRSQGFSVRVEFIDDVDYNLGLASDETRMDNNLAQNQSVVFDLVVTAIQSTAQN